MDPACVIVGVRYCREAGVRVIEHRDDRYEEERTSSGGSVRTPTAAVAPTPSFNGHQRPTTQRYRRSGDLFLSESTQRSFMNTEIRSTAALYFGIRSHGFKPATTANALTCLWAISNAVASCRRSIGKDCRIYSKRRRRRPFLPARRRGSTLLNVASAAAAAAAAAAATATDSSFRSTLTAYTTCHRSLSASLPPAT